MIKYICDIYKNPETNWDKQYLHDEYVDATYQVTIHKPTFIINPKISHLCQNCFNLQLSYYQNELDRNTIVTISRLE